MLRIYLSQTLRHSCIGSDRPQEIVDFLGKAGVRRSTKQLQRMLGYFWIHVAGDDHLRAMKAAHPGIPRAVYQDLAQLGLSLLGRKLGMRWHFSGGVRIPNQTERERRLNVQRELTLMESRRAL